MGANLISGCHGCKTQIFHLRGAEHRTMMPFFLKHGGCGGGSHIETYCDWHADPNWEAEYEDDPETDKWHSSDKSRLKTLTEENKVLREGLEMVANSKKFTPVDWIIITRETLAKADKAGGE